MGVTAPGKDVGGARNMSHPSNKGSTPPPGPPVFHLLTLLTLLTSQDTLPPHQLITIPSVLQGTMPPLPGTFQKCSLPPLNREHLGCSSPKTLPLATCVPGLPGRDCKV